MLGMTCDLPTHACMHKCSRRSLFPTINGARRVPCGRTLAINVASPQSPPSWHDQHSCRSPTCTSQCCSQVPGSGPVSLGCTWFHGVLGHPLYELALQEGLLQQDVRLSRAAMKEGPSWKVGAGRGARGSPAVCRGAVLQLHVHHLTGSWECWHTAVCGAAAGLLMHCGSVATVAPQQVLAAQRSCSAPGRASLAGPAAPLPLEASQARQHAWLPTCPPACRWSSCSPWRQPPCQGVSRSAWWLAAWSTARWWARLAGKQGAAVAVTVAAAAAAGAVGMWPAAMRRAALCVEAAVGGGRQGPVMLVQLPVVLPLWRCRPWLHTQSRREAQQQQIMLQP